MKQMTLAAGMGFEKHARLTRKAEFLSRMETLVPWSAFCSLIEPHYPKAGNGRPPVGLERMLRVGENTGELDTALTNVSYFYNRDVRESIEKVQAMIEPVMTIIIGLILGWIMLAVLGPIYDIITKMKT